MPLDQIPNKAPIPEKVSFNQVVRHPVTYALVIIVVLLMIAVGINVSLYRSNLNTYKEELKGCKIEREQLKKDNSDIFKALLIKEGIILKVENKIDSTSHEKLNN